MRVLASLMMASCSMDRVENFSTSRQRSVAAGFGGDSGLEFERCFVGVRGVFGVCGVRGGFVESEPLVVLVVVFGDDCGSVDSSVDSSSLRR